MPSQAALEGHTHTERVSSRKKAGVGIQGEQQSVTDYANLEISLDPAAIDGQYRVSLRFRLPGPNQDFNPATDPELTQLDLAKLGALADTSADDCGAELAQSLLPVNTLLKFVEAKGASGGRMRVRLRISKEAPELHSLRWETLHLPGTANVRLAADENRPLSRYLNVWDQRELSPAPRGTARALVVIANPSGVPDLAQVTVAEELARVRAGLGDIPATVLCRPPIGAVTDCAGPPTFDKIVELLPQGYDILYFVCHGELVNGLTPRLLLEDKNGAVDYVHAEDVQEPGGLKLGFADVLRHASQPPRLIVLASCESAGTGAAWDDGSALRAMGPRLVEAGVPAVLAMQGSTPMAMAADFMPKFFTELRRDGVVDRAVAAARQYLIARGHDTWWMPVLFMRLESGQLNLKKGLNAPFMAAELRGFVQRPALLTKVRAKLTDVAPPRVLALHGSGGFGKTTLARALCHDPAVWAAFPDGILWSTLGQQPTESQILARLSTLHKAIGGEQQPFADLDDAANALANQLGDKRCLMVVDDVWDTEALAHFREGGPNCTRLITTGQFKVGMDADDQIPIDEMEVSEGAELLALQLEAPQDALPSLQNLAVSLGRWPLLLELMNGVLRMKLKLGATFDQSIQSVQDALEQDGLFAFDKGKTSDKTIRISMDQLEQMDRNRLVQLAIFPAGVAIPLPQARRLWGLTENKTERVAEALHALSLAKLDLQNGTLHLHAAMRAYLVEQLAQHFDQADLHVKLVDAWGNDPTLPDRYARQWAAYHLREAVRLGDGNRRLRLVERMVQLLTDTGFQTAYLADLHDPAGLQRDLEQMQTLALDEVKQALDVNPAKPDLGALPTLVAAARGLAAFRRNQLAPGLIFELAGSGDIQAALRQLSIFGAEREWRIATQLIIAWLDPRKQSVEATRLLAGLEGELDQLDRLKRLAARVQSALDEQHQTVDSVSDPGMAEVQDVLVRMAGMATQLGEPTEQMGETNSLGPNVSNSYEASAHIRPEASEAFKLISYARHHPQEGWQHVEDYLSILAANAYVQYRNQFLWPLLDLVVCYSESPWAEDMAAKIAAAALAPNRMEFEDALPITILALMAAAHTPGLRNQLDGYRDRVKATAALLEPDTSRGDAWGSYTRRLAALAQAYSLLGEPAEARALWKQAQRLHFGFAGFMGLARLTLAETILTSDPFSADAVVQEAFRSAHNVQDPVFCAQTTARCNALQERWWGVALNSMDLVQTANALFSHPQAPEFTAQHRVGEIYRNRSRAPLPGWASDAYSLWSLSLLYCRPVEELEKLNPGIGRYEDLRKTQNPPPFINIPDPGMPPLLAARLSSAVANRVSISKMGRSEAVGVMSKLISIAADNGTALDTVLSWALVAAQPLLSPNDLAALAAPYGDLTGTLANRLANDTATPQASESSWIP